MQSFIALTLFKAEQTSVVVKAQTLLIFIKIAQNKGNHKLVSNLYWQFINNKTHFWLKMYQIPIIRYNTANQTESQICLEKEVILVELALPCLTLKITL